MPSTIIQTFDVADESGFTIFDANFEFAATGVKAKTRKAIFDAVFEFEATGVSDHAGEGIFDAAFEFEATGFLDANIFADEAIFDAAFEFQATGSISREQLAIFDAAFEFAATGELIVPERFYWNVLVNTGSSVIPGRYREFAVRLTVDGNEMPIVSFECQQSRKGSYLSSLNINLGNKTNFDAVSRDSVIKFEKGEKISGSWVWKTLIDTGQTSGKSYGITRNLDTYSFSVIAGYNARLMKAPTTDLVVYDSADISLSSDDFEAIRDTNGNIIATELKPFYQMTLFDLLHEIFIVRCGFSGIECNIADYRVTREDFRAGRPFIETLKNVMAAYSPDITADADNNIVIRDTSYLYNEGDPAPTQITLASDLITVNLDRQFDRLDGFRLSYSVSRREFDYTADRQASRTEPYGTFGSGNFQEVTVTNTYRDYFRNSDPYTPVDTDLIGVSKSTVMNAQTIFESNETWAFDVFGNETTRNKTYSKRLPDLENGGDLSLLTLKTENENSEYKPHPFIRGAQYRSKHEVYEYGRQVVDTTNQQLGEDWKRDYENAYRGGNLTEDLTVLNNTPLRTLIEQFRPLRGGKAEVSVYEVDHAGSESVILQDSTEIVPGEIATSGRSKQQLETFVLEEGDSITEDSIIEDLNAGQIPPGQAKALTLRLLKKRKASPQTKRAEVAGLDDRLVKGFVTNLRGRGGEDLGVYSIEGVTIRGDRNGIFTSIEAEELVSSGVMPLITEHENGNVFPALNTPIIIRRRIPCQAGYFLRCDAVAGLTVEARKESVGGSWTDIETTPIDLSADAGNVIVYEFRLTGTVLGIRTAKINVGR